IHTFEWNFGDGNSAVGDSVMHSYSQNGSYNVRLVAMGYCGMDTLHQTVNISKIGMAESLLEESLEIYPNPAHDLLTVAFRSNQKGSVELVDISGKVILKREF